MAQFNIIQEKTSKDRSERGNVVMDHAAPLKGNVIIRAFTEGNGKREIILPRLK